MPETPNRAQLRRLLTALMPRPPDLEAFCLDHFAEVHQRFTSGQERKEKTNILLSCVEPADLWAALCESFPNVDEHLEAARHSTGASVLRPLSAAEKKHRERYLRELREHLENLREASIHRACFINLGMEDNPAATRDRDPWIYRNPDSKQEFDSIGAALAAYDRRLLILGAPGAGKTTSLEHIALQLLEEAERDPDKPVPLILNLSLFHFAKESLPSSPLSWLVRSRTRSSATQVPEAQLERWLIQELSARARIGKRAAERWLTEERVAVLLDGLDEVEDTRRAALAQHLNELFLADHPELCVVVCSRVHDYEPLKEDERTQLQLEGAVMLQPLSPQQIDDYLTAAQATGLKDALVHDASLRELAATPLTLSMMTLAYGGSAPPQLPPESPLTEKRHQLMEAYVARMLQRKERRDRGRPFDQSRKNDVPEAEYCYPPEEVNRRLGWLAARMSVRMQTACSLDRFYSFLRQGDSLLPARDGIAVDLALGLFLALVLAVIAAQLLPATLGGMLTGIGVLAAVVAAFVGSSALARWAADSWVTVALVIGFFVLADGAVARSLSALLPLGIAPVPMGILVASALFALLFGLFSLSAPRNWPRFFLHLGMTLAALGASALLSARFRFAWMDHGGWLASLLLAAQALYFCTLSSKGERVQGGVEALILVVAAVAGSAVGFWAIGHLPGPRELILLVLLGLAAVLPLLESATSYSWFFGLVACASLGAQWARSDGAVAGAALFALVALIWRIQFTKLPMESLRLQLSKLAALFDQRFLSPALVRILSLLGALPVRRSRFFRYCREALLLKPSATEIEFIHRILRDYFALRELVPRLGIPAERLSTIRALGYQGESAIDTLAELCRDADSGVRAAAAESLGRITAPAATEILRRAASDSSPEVRAAVVASMAHGYHVALADCLESAKRDPSPALHLAILKLLTSANRIIRWNAENLISLLGPLLPEDEPRPELMRQVILTMKSFSEPDRRTYLDALSECLPAWAWESLPGFLTSPDPALCLSTIRLMAAGPLEGVLDTEAAAALHTALRSKDAEVYTAAALLLGRVGDTKAVPTLIPLLKHKTATLREQAAVLLGELRDPRAFKPLLRLLRDPGRDVQAAAVKALGNIGDARALKPLRQLAARTARFLPLSAQITSALQAIERDNKV